MRGYRDDYSRQRPERIDYEPEDLKRTTDLNQVQIWLEDITEAIEDEEYTPSDWEVEFLESITKRLDRWIEKAQVLGADFEPEEDQPLSGKQLVSLRQLYDKIEG